MGEKTPNPSGRVPGELREPLREFLGDEFDRFKHRFFNDGGTVAFDDSANTVLAVGEEVRKLDGQKGIKIIDYEGRKNKGRGGQLTLPQGRNQRDMERLSSH